MKPGTIHWAISLAGDTHPQQHRSQMFSPCVWSSEPLFKEKLSTFLADRGRHRGTTWIANENTESLMYLFIFTLPTGACPGPSQFRGLLLRWGQRHSTLDTAHTSLCAGRNEAACRKGKLKVCICKGLPLHVRKHGPKYLHFEATQRHSKTTFSCSNTTTEQPIAASQLSSGFWTGFPNF